MLLKLFLTITENTSLNLLKSKTYFKLIKLSETNNFSVVKPSANFTLDSRPS